MLSEEEIRDRRPVWNALSELFLDTELDDRDHSAIAQILFSSKYALSEIEDILYAEVYPVCICNLHSPAGEWEGFSPDWLEEEIRKHVARKAKVPEWLQLSRWMIQEHWEQIKAAYALLVTEDTGSDKHQK